MTALTKAHTLILNKNHYDLPSRGIICAHPTHFPVNFQKPLGPCQEKYTSQDMETDALYLLGRLRQIECLSLLISYPKHETAGEYQDAGRTKAFEDKVIQFALKLLTGV